MAKKFNFHLFEFTRSECEVSRRNFVSKALSDLCDSQWKAKTCAVDHVLKVDKNSLCRFGAEECHIIFTA